MEEKQVSKDIQRWGKLRQEKHDDRIQKCGKRSGVGDLEMGETEAGFRDTRKQAIQWKLRHRIQKWGILK